MLAALPVLASLLLLPAAAGASALSSGTGSFTTTGQVVSVRQADGNTIVTATEVHTRTGALTGTRRAIGIEIYHPDGTFTAHDSGPFTGTVDGRQHHHQRGQPRDRHHRQRPDRRRPRHRRPGRMHLQGTSQPVITSSTTAEGTYSIQFHFDS